MKEPCASRTCSAGLSGSQSEFASQRARTRRSGTGRRASTLATRLYKCIRAPDRLWRRLQCSMRWWLIGSRRSTSRYWCPETAEWHGGRTAGVAQRLLISSGGGRFSAADGFLQFRGIAGNACALACVWRSDRCRVPGSQGPGAGTVNDP